MTQPPLRHAPSLQATACIGTERSFNSRLAEAPLRMLLSDFHPDVAKSFEDLAHYSGVGCHYLDSGAVASSTLEAEVMQEGIDVAHTHLGRVLCNVLDTEVMLRQAILSSELCTLDELTFVGLPGCSPSYDAERPSAISLSNPRT